ncbi:MAG TPA: Spy/CpxP family protein refolding chaperone [Gemmatimonadaceae bacterium]
MHRIVRGAVLGLLALAWPMGLEAQQGRGRPDRAQLEQRFRERLAAVVRERLRLTDDQMRQLSAVNQRYDVQRRELFRREMQLRRDLRAQLIDRDNPSEEEVGRLLSEQLRIQRERIALLEAEQNDLSRFLTPVQRARYLGIQEQVRREIERRRAPPEPDGRGRRPPVRPPG